MIDRAKRALSELVDDDALFARAVVRAQMEAIRRHRLLGQPVAIWRDGRVVVELADTPLEELPAWPP